MNGKLEVKGGAISTITDGKSPLKGKVENISDTHVQVRLDYGKRASFMVKDGSIQKVLNQISDIIKLLNGKGGTKRTPQQVLTQIGVLLRNGGDLLFGGTPEKTDTVRVSDIRWSGDTPTTLFALTNVTGQINCGSQVYSKAVRLKHSATIGNITGKGFLSPTNFGGTTITGSFNGGALVSSGKATAWDNATGVVTITSITQGIVGLVRDAITSVASGDVDEIINIISNVLDPRDRSFALNEMVINLIVNPEESQLTAFHQNRANALASELEALRQLFSILLLDTFVPSGVITFSDDVRDQPLNTLPMIGPALAEDLSIKLGADTVGHLITLGSETDGSFNPDRLRAELNAVNLRRGLVELSDPDITRLVDNLKLI